MIIATVLQQKLETLYPVKTSSLVLKLRHNKHNKIFVQRLKARQFIRNSLMQDNFQ